MTVLRGPAPPALLDLAVATAREAAAARRGAAGRRRPTQVDVKSSPVDVVTAVDTRQRASSSSAGCSAPGPTTACWGRRAPTRAGTSGVRWVVDPIDGTVNFLYGLPAYAVSIAAEVDGEVRGRGRAQRGDRRAVHRDAGRRRLPVLAGRAGAGAADRQRAGVAGADAGGHRVRLPGGAAAGAGRGRRRSCCRGSATSAGTAARRWTCAPPRPGRVDAYYELDLKPWDHAAGALVAAEAGLVVTGLAGRPFAEPMAVAAAPSIAGPFVDLLAELHPGLSRPAQQAAAASPARRERGGDLLRGGERRPNSGPMTRSTCAVARVSW